MQLKDQILKGKPRETSGPRTSRKYDFQKNLSIYLLVERHRSDSNYVVLFDYHDDLMILDSDTTPDKIDFYQIKSSDQGPWTISKLIASRAEKLSVLGKLYYNKLQFPQNTRSLNFVSNAVYNFEKLIDGSNSNSKQEIKGTEMSINDINKCNEKIKKEHSLSEDSLFENITAFRVTDLSNKDSSTHCIGILSKLINDLNPNNKINPALAYKQVFSEINKKNNYDSSEKSYSDLNELIQYKGVSRKQFEEILKKAGLYKSSEEEWDDLEKQLSQMNVGHLIIREYKNAWRSMNALLLKEKSNAPIERLIEEISQIISTVSRESAFQNLKLIDLTDKIYDLVNNKTLLDEKVTKCLIIKQLNEE